MKNTSYLKAKIAQQTSAVWNWLLRLVSPASLCLGLLALIALILGFFWCIHAVFSGVASEVTSWVNSVTDPVERGCAYIAISIGIHAFMIGFKTMSHDNVKVEIKKDSAPVD